MFKDLLKIIIIIIIIMSILVQSIIICIKCPKSRDE